MARYKQGKAFKAMHFVGLTKILCSSFLVCSDCHSDMKSLNVNQVTDYNLAFLVLFNPLVIGIFWCYIDT